MKPTSIGPISVDFDEVRAMLRPLSEIDQTPDDAVVEQIHRYAEMTALWNTKTDLVGSADAATLLDILLTDAVQLCRHSLIPRGSHWVDVGAGAGAPSLGLALLRGDTRATLIEPRRRRVTFMRAALGSVGLAGRVRVHEGRVGDEQANQGHIRPPLPSAPPFDVALSRATFAPDQWLPIGAQLAPRVLVLTAQPTPVSNIHGRTPAYTVSYRTVSGAPRSIAAYDCGIGTP